MRLGFPKKERLKGRQLIERLFTEGKSMTAFPLKLIYLKTTLPKNVPIQATFSVSKRVFKRAVHRNRVKRQMREAYRLQKATFFNHLKTPHAFMFLYLGKELPTFQTIQTAVKNIAAKIKDL